MTLPAVKFCPPDWSNPSPSGSNGGAKFTKSSYIRQIYCTCVSSKISFISFINTISLIKEQHSNVACEKKSRQLYIH